MGERVKIFHANSNAASIANLEEEINQWIEKINSDGFHHIMEVLQTCGPFDSVIISIFYRNE